MVCIDLPSPSPRWTLRLEGALGRFVDARGVSFDNAPAGGALPGGLRMDEEAKPGAAASPVAVVELFGRDGRPQLLQRVGSWPARIGRSPACEVVLDDPTWLAEHAVLDWTPEGGVQLRALPSLNGGEMAGEALKPEELAGRCGVARPGAGGCALRIRHIGGGAGGGAAAGRAGAPPLARCPAWHCSWCCCSGWTAGAAWILTPRWSTTPRRCWGLWWWWQAGGVRGRWPP